MSVISTKFLQITPNALTKIHANLDGQDNSNLFLRLSATFKGVRYFVSLDAEKKSDDHEDLIYGVLVVIDTLSYLIIEGAILDYNSTDGYILTNTNVNKSALSNSGCACFGSEGC